MSIHEKVTENDLSEAKSVHIIWHKFDKWLVKTFGENYSSNLSGYDAICKVEKYVRRNLPEIRIVQCDDFDYSSSIIVLVPHPRHGISVIFIPQTAEIGNKFFLYGSHYDCLVKELSDMKKVYENVL
jgi:hypothetical protein